MATLAPEIPDIEITVPDELADRIDVVEVGDAVEVAVLKKISDLNSKSETGTTTAFAGNSIIDSSLQTRSEKGDSSAMTFNNKKINRTEIEVKGRGDAILNVNTGRIANSNIKFNRSGNDSIKFANGVEVKNVTVDAGKGADTITFRERSIIKGTNVVTLGNGKDVLVLPVDKNGGGEIRVTDLSDNDTIKIGDNTYSGKDILAGKIDDLPDYLVIEGLD